MLGVFQKLLASRAHFHEALAILGSLIESLPLSSVQPFLPTIWGLLFQKCVAKPLFKHLIRNLDPRPCTPLPKSLSHSTMLVCCRLFTSGA